jgi:hypothetical protein
MVELSLKKIIDKLNREFYGKNENLFFDMIIRLIL